MIKVFGDSHALMFGEDIGVHCGALTAYNLDNKHNDKIFPLLKKHGVIKKPVENVGFIFGEIDCRIHIYNQHMKTGEHITNLVSNTVEKYINYLTMLKEEKICNPIVYTVVPPGNQGNAYKYKYYADYEVRKLITFSFNHYLYTFCRKHNILLINYYNLVADLRGNRFEKYVYDKVHLNQEAGKIIIDFTEAIYLLKE